MSTIVIKPGRAGSRFALMLTLCVIALVQACDRSNTDAQPELAVESKLPVSGNATKTETTQPPEAAISPTPSDTAIAPTDIVVMALSTYDVRAVVMSAQGEMQAMKPGDLVHGTQMKLVDILDDRLVFEMGVTKPTGSTVMETIWIYKAIDGVSRVQVLKQDSPEIKGQTVKKTIRLGE